MKDGYGRTIDYLRISITDRCNLRCTYCMPEEGIPCLAHGDILTYEEIETICRAMAQIGLKHVRITGGEPLVRRQCWRLVEKLRRIPRLQTVTLTTNGILLAQYALILSLSPKTSPISAVETTSFSLKIGTTPRSRRVPTLSLRLL